MPSSLHLVKEVVNGTFDLFDMEGAGLLDLEEFSLAIAALGIDVSQSESETMFKNAKGATDNQLPISKEEFTIIVHDWNHKQTFHGEVEKMFKLFGKRSSMIEEAHFNDVHEEIGWEADEDKIDNFIRVCKTPTADAKG